MAREGINYWEARKKLQHSNEPSTSTTNHSSFPPLRNNNSTAQKRLPLSINSSGVRRLAARADNHGNNERNGPTAHHCEDNNMDPGNLTTSERYEDSLILTKAKFVQIITEVIKHTLLSLQDGLEINVENIIAKATGTSPDKSTTNPSQDIETSLPSDSTSEPSSCDKSRDFMVANTGMDTTPLDLSTKQNYCNLEASGTTSNGNGS